MIPMRVRRERNKMKYLQLTEGKIEISVSVLIKMMLHAVMKWTFVWCEKNEK